MTEHPRVASATWTEQWWRSYAKLSTDRQAACDRVVMALIRGKSLPGLEVKPIPLDERYLEARIDAGDRIVSRVEPGAIFLVDVIEGNAIGRRSRRSRATR